MAIYFRVL